MHDRETGNVLSAVDVVARYRGFTGEPWPLEDDLIYPRLEEGGLPGPEMIGAVREYWEAAQRTTPSDLIYLDTDCIVRKSVGGVRLRFLGWDYGYYESHWNEYSSLFNECLFGKYAQLARFTGSLNADLLFRELALCEIYATCRDALLGEGADLEDDDSSYPVGIYAPLM